MANEIDLHLNIQNSLNQTLKETQATMRGFNSLLEQSGKNLNISGKSAGVVSDKFVDIEKYSEKVTKNTGLISRNFEKAKTAILGIITGGGLLNLAKDSLAVGTAMKQLSFRMGEAGKTAEQLRTATYRIGTAAGITTKEAAGLVGELRRLRVPTGDIEELGTATAKFSEITGITTENAGRLTGELVRVGKLGAPAAKSMLTAMANMQREVGMSEGEMEGLNETLIKSTQVLGQYGKSAVQIETFNKGVIKLAGSFSKVGVSAERAGQLIDKLLDPTNIEDNALLYTKMGISIQDAISGNIDPEQMQRGLKNLGSEIKNMGFAGNMLAKSMGMSANELKAMADMDLSKGGGAKDLGTMFEEQLSPEQKFMKSMTTIRDLITQIIDKFTNSKVAETLTSGLKGLVDKLPKIVEGAIKLIGNITNPRTWLVIGAIFGIVLLLLRRKFKEVAGGFKEDLVTAVSSGITMGAQKAASTKILAPPVATRGATATTNDRVTVGPDYKRMQATASLFDTMAKSNLFPSVARMTQNTADWIRHVSEGGKKMSLLQIKTEENNRVIRDKLRFSAEENMMITEKLNSMRDEKIKQKDIYDTRIKQLNDIKEKNGKLTGDQEFELIRLNKLAKKLIIEESKLKERVRNQDLRATGLEEKFMLRMSKEDLKAQYDKLSAVKEQKNLDLEMNKIKMIDKREEAETLGLMIRQTEKDKENLFNKIKAGDATKETRIEYERVNKEITELSNRQRGLVTEQKELNTGIEEQQKELNKVEDEMKKIRGVIAETGKKQEMLVALKEEKTLEMEINKTRSEGIDKELHDIRLNRDKLGIEKLNLEEKIKSGKFDKLDLESLNKINKELKIEESKRKGLIVEQTKLNTATEKQKKEIDKVEKELERIKKVGSKRGYDILDVDLPMLKTKTRKLLDFVGSSLRNAGMKISDGFDKAKLSAKQIVENLKEGLKPSNIVSSIGAGIRNRFTAEGRRGVAERAAEDAAKREAAGQAPRRSLASRVGGVARGAGRAAGAMGRGLGGAMNSLGGILRKIGIPMIIMAALLPMLTPILNKVKEGITNLAPMFENLIGALSPIVDKILPIIVNLVTNLIPIVEQIFAAIIPVINTLIDFISSLFKGNLFESIKKAVTGLLNALLPVIQNLLPVIFNLVKGLLPVILKVINTVIGVFSKLLPLVTQIIQIIVNSLGPVLTELIDALLPIIDLLIPLAIDLVKGLLPLILKALGGVLVIIGSLIQGIGELGKTLMELPMSLDILFLRLKKGLAEIFKPLSPLAKLSDEQFEANIAEKQDAYRRFQSEFNPVYKLLDKVSGIGEKLSVAGKSMMNSNLEASKGPKVETSLTGSIPITTSTTGEEGTPGEAGKGSVFQAGQGGSLSRTGDLIAATEGSSGAGAVKTTEAERRKLELDMADKNLKLNEEMAKSTEVQTATLDIIKKTMEAQLNVTIDQKTAAELAWKAYKLMDVTKSLTFDDAIKQVTSRVGTVGASQQRSSRTGLVGTGIE